MRTMRYWLALGVLAGVITVGATGETYARVRVSIGFGAHVGGYGPHYGSHSDWYWHHGRGPVYPWYWYPYDPMWVYDYDPVFLGPPVVVERHVVVENAAPAPQAPVATLPEAEQNKRQELIERLRIGDDDSRVKATEALAAFNGDETVREALEKALSSDRQPTVRAAAAKALVKQAGEKAVPALKRAYKEDADRQVSQAAYKALIMIQGY